MTSNPTQAARGAGNRATHARWTRDSRATAATFLIRKESSHG